MLGRHQIYLGVNSDECGDAEDLNDIMANCHLNNHFLNLAREVLNNA